MNDRISTDRTASRLARSLVLAAVLAGTVVAMSPAPARAQMLPPQENTKKDAPVKVEAQPSSFGFYQKYLGENSPYRGVIVGVITLFVLVTVYKFSTRRIRK